jgi:hypothetical protein
MSEGSSTPPAKSDRVLRSHRTPKNEESCTGEDEKEIKSVVANGNGKVLKKRKRGTNELEPKDIETPTKLRKNVVIVFILPY